MTSDEARDLFADVVENTLDPAKKDAFDAAIASDAELRAELEAYRMVIGGAARIAARSAEEPAPDLLPKVQLRLRKRSRGRFYRDRFAEQAGPKSAIPVLVAIMVAVLIAAAWVATQSMIVIEAPGDDGREGTVQP